MRLLLFSDLHCDAAAAEQLVAAASRADVVVGAGDYANLRRNLFATINLLRSIAVPTILVPGNAESYEELAAACRNWPSARVLHGTGTSVEGVEFFGLGGGVPVTPFGSWSYDFTEDQATQLLSTCPANCVLVSHAPPKGCLDVSSRGGSLGSTAVRAAIELCTPRLVVCGHIHECGGQTATLADTTVINAGPAGMVWVL